MKFMKTQSDLSMELQFTDAYRQHKDDHIAIREAMCLKAQFPAICASIQEPDLIAGRIEWGLVGFSPHNGPPGAGYGYYCYDVSILEALQKGNIPIEQRDVVLEMLQFWKKETSRCKVEATYDERMVKYLYRDEISPVPFNYKPMVGQPIYRMAGIYLDYQKMMQLGIPGMQAEAMAYREKAKEKGGDADLFEGMLIALDAFIDTCGYYQQQALELAEEASDQQRQAELQEMARVLEVITVSPPSSLHEAIQLSFLYSMMCGTIEFGRMDVYLGEFYVNDIDQGVITEDQALALMHTVWRLINDQIRDVDGRVIIGGKGRPNEEIADRFALLALETTRTYGKAILPQLTLRFYEGMNPELLEKAYELIGEGHTFPLLYNDDVLVEATAHAMDIPASVAEHYCPLGCGEIVLDHMGFGTPNGALNVLKALEITLHNGVDPITGQRLGLATGELADFETFDDFYEAYKQQLNLYIEILADFEELEYVETGKDAPYLYLSMLYDDCMERGKGMFDGGVRYLSGTLETYGNVNAADSLTTIKQLLFEQKAITPERLLEVLENNFRGYEDERRLMLDCPKYGNDDEQADSMMVGLHDYLCNTIRDQRERTNLFSYLNVIINNSQNTTLARWVGASADGRKAGTPMANANTPSGGSDQKGVTAMMNSIIKPSPAIHAGSVQNIRFGKDIFTSQKEKFEALMETYFQRGGSQAMVTVINRGDLEKALLEPEKYKDVFVRVGGFSARFVDLPGDVQVDILSRTTY
jgi:pyruvate-formate lyase